MITISLAQILTWLLLGGITGLIIHFVSSGRSIGRSVILGLAGALVGGLIFSLFNIRVAPELLRLEIIDAVITFSDIVAALTGAVIVLGLMLLLRRSGRL
jgi:uncharacterized membrane protein YeaQ/YmgE (transglycosylase-associated protein family)